MLPSGLPDNVADGEDLARFLTSHGYFNSKMVKPAAFLPNPADQKTSVCRHGKEPQEELRELATEYLPVGKKVYGAGICKTADVRAARLDVTSEEPPRRHANMVGWPVNVGDPDLQKAEQKELAGVIASQSVSVMFRDGE
jgi:hypothetical protein